MFSYLYSNVAGQSNFKNIPLNPVSFSVGTDRDVTFWRANENLRIKIIAEIKEGWSIYTLHPKSTALIPTEISGSNHLLNPLTPWYESHPKLKTIDSLGLSLIVHSDQAYFYRNYSIADQVIPENEQKIAFNIQYQACSNSICLLPATANISFDLKIEPGKARVENQIIDKQIDTIKGAQNLNGLFLNIGWLSFLLLAISAGLITLISPCVLPMIPLTLSYFTNQNNNHKKQRTRTILIFIVTITISYMSFGLLISAIWGAAAVLRIATSPVINLIAAGIFLYFGLSIVGVFKFNLPGKLLNSLNNFTSNWGTISNAFVVGFGFTIFSFTCNLQIIGSLLVLSAQGQYYWPIIGMLFYSLAIVLPLSAFVFIPNLLKLLKGGIWQRMVQIILAGLMFFMAIKFLSNYDLLTNSIAISRNGALISIISIFGLLFVYSIYLNIINIKITNKLKAGLFNILIILVIYGTTISYFAKGLNDYTLGGYIDSLLPPVTEGSYLKGGDFIDDNYAPLIWYEEIRRAQIKAIDDNKPLFIMFSGYTCVNCRWVEQNVLQNKKVYESLKDRFILVRLYTDGGDNFKQNQQIQIDKFNTVALPFFAILDNQLMVKEEHAGIFKNVESFFSFID